MYDALKFLKSQNLYEVRLRISSSPITYVRGEPGIFSSPIAYTVHEGKNVEFFQVPKSQRKLGLGIFPKTIANIEGKRSEIFYVPEPIWGVRNPIYQHIFSYSFIFSTYSIFLKYFFTFLLISSYFRHYSFIFS